MAEQTALQDPFAEFRDPTGPPAQPLETAPGAGDDPFAEFRTKSQSSSGPGLQPVQRTQDDPFAEFRPPTSSGSGDPFLRPAIQDQKKPDADSPWYSRAWNPANTPLTTTLLGSGAHREGPPGW